ncbi:MAG: relaxase MobL [Rickettsiales bacterium]|jgi:hypothetical protein|nr:relaxase MobL [Rickettsiales bacterium]MDR2830530.1 relaxase MobL [Candidatus Methanovirga basalitermitum]
MGSSIAREELGIKRNSSRIILNCRYFKGSKKTTSLLKNLVKYISTREGVEKDYVSSKNDDKPATKKQIKLLKDLEYNFGLAYDLYEFEDFQREKTQKSASELISVIIDNNLNRILLTKEHLVKYVAKRPRVDKKEVSEHGLFCVSDNGVSSGDVDLLSIMNEVSKHRGKIWTNVLSLRREDAKKVGFENLESWRDLLKYNICEISEQMKIELDKLKVYGAFHNEGHHPHCHFLVWSSEPGNESLYKEGIKKLKSSFANSIFREEMLPIMKKKSLLRDEIKIRLKKTIDDLGDNLKINGARFDSDLEMKMINFSNNISLKDKTYGYLREPLKMQVNDIVYELFKSPEIELLYEQWKEQRRELSQFYEHPSKIQDLELLKNEEFKPVLNLVLKEARKIRSFDSFNNLYNEFTDPNTTPFSGILNEFVKSFHGGGNSQKQDQNDIFDKKKRKETAELKKRLGILRR